MFLDPASTHSGSVHPYGTFWLDVADKVVKLLAVVVAGFWTYYRAETFRRKIELSVSGELFESGDNHFASVMCRMKNIGSSRYEIRQSGTGLQSEAIKFPPPRKHLGTAEVFMAHKWLEPGEEICEPIIIKIDPPTSFIALRLNLRVIAGKRVWIYTDGKGDTQFTLKFFEWNASCIIRDADLSTKGDNDIEC